MGVAKATGYAGALPQFMLQLARKLDNASEVVLVAEFAKATGHQQLGLRLSKIAFNRVPERWEFEERKTSSDPLLARLAAKKAKTATMKKRGETPRASSG